MNRDLGVCVSALRALSASVWAQEKYHSRAVTIEPAYAISSLASVLQAAS